MGDIRRYAPWAVFGIGMLLIITSDLLDPARRVHLPVTVGGAVLAFLGIVWAELRSTHGCLVDERYVAIHHRSGYFAFTALGALLVVGTVVLVNTDVAVSAEAVLLGAASFGIVAYRGSVAWFKRTM